MSDIQGQSKSGIHKHAGFIFLMQITPEEHDSKRWLTYSGILNSQTYQYIEYWFG